MSFSFNQITLFGNIGQTPETRTTTSGMTVTTFSVATSYSYKKKDSNSWEEETTWHNVVIWKPSDWLLGQLHKGQKVLVVGRLTKRDYENKEGNKVYVTEVVANTCIPSAKFEQPNREHSGKSEDYNHFPNTPVENAGEDDDLPF